jgi:hypothetical protein
MIVIAIVIMIVIVIVIAILRYHYRCLRFTVVVDGRGEDVGEEMNGWMAWRKPKAKEHAERRRSEDRRPTDEPNLE